MSDRISFSSGSPLVTGSGRIAHTADGVASFPDEGKRRLAALLAEMEAAGAEKPVDRFVSKHDLGDETGEN